jgi:hypothetical protein
MPPKGPAEQIQLLERSTAFFLAVANVNAHATQLQGVSAYSKARRTCVVFISKPFRINTYKDQGEGVVRTKADH